jgi:hypothetical protein
VGFWTWLKENDAPNWFGIAFSLIVWPAFLYWWNTRKRQSVPHLEVLAQPGQTTIDGQQFPSVDLIFTNRTGRVVYLSHARLRESKKRFPIPLPAVRDISGGWRELKFEKGGVLSEQECILQTNGRIMTNIAVTTPMDQGFYTHRPGWFRRCGRYPKYFRLQYTAMAGGRTYFVDTAY